MVDISFKYASHIDNKQIYIFVWQKETWKQCPCRPTFLPPTFGVGLSQYRRTYLWLCIVSLITPRYILYTGTTMSLMNHNLVTL